MGHQVYSFSHSPKCSFKDRLDVKYNLEKKKDGLLSQKLNEERWSVKQKNNTERYDERKIKFETNRQTDKQTNRQTTDKQTNNGSQNTTKKLTIE